MTRVSVKPELLSWAIERAGTDPERLSERFPRLHEWIDGETQPTVKQLEKFAKSVHAPIGFLFLSEPPEEALPIPDFRTVNGRELRRPSPNLLDMIYSCQERQSWYREHARLMQLDKLSFVGSVSTQDKIEDVAAQMRATLDFDVQTQASCSTWEEALRCFIQSADRVGILVMVSGIVHSNTTRKLDPQEFRGFALSDETAPLVFINGSDSKSAQMFTLAHELAHIWLNASALSNAGASPLNGHRREEVWCNAVAAEFLVPAAALRVQLFDDETPHDARNRLARYFKVSGLVILRRLFDIGWLNQTQFDSAWAQEMAAIRERKERSTGGGDFYRSTMARVSKRFTQALVTSTLEGQTLYRDAFRMLGVKKTESFNELGRKAEVLL